MGGIRPRKMGVPPIVATQMCAVHPVARETFRSIIKGLNPMNFISRSD
jgi:hypothetical protein